MQESSQHDHQPLSIPSQTCYINILINRAGCASTPSGYWTDSHGRGRMWGDMNGDGELTSADALMILQDTGYAYRSVFSDRYRTRFDCIVHHHDIHWGFCPIRAGTRQLPENMHSNPYRACSDGLCIQRHIRACHLPDRDTDRNASIFMGIHINL